MAPDPRHGEQDLHVSVRVEREHCDSIARGHSQCVAEHVRKATRGAQHLPIRRGPPGRIVNGRDGVGALLRSAAQQLRHARELARRPRQPGLGRRRGGQEVAHQDRAA